ncbi:hypothetical protein BE21_52775 [Sorangium cellulosum]|uniref:Uncharacterized protein n=1 Tax=Sorangium cellulosum TaxID=56 RepID=A0A150TET0_SORCE|nr:hypothetical protein BE21_52775 [Sorangium cellulosum]
MIARALPFGARARFRGEEPAILRQDRLLLESAEAASAGQGDLREHHVEADAPALLLRRFLDWAARGEWEQRRASLPELHPAPPGHRHARGAVQPHRDGPVRLFVELHRKGGMWLYAARQNGRENEKSLAFQRASA